MSVTIIQDSYFLGITGGIWTDSTMGWYNGTAVYASKANSTTADHDLVHATFQGTSVSFFGVTPTSNVSTTFIVDMDGAANYTATYPSSGVGCTWYTSYQVADETNDHGLNLYDMDQTIIDYILITAGTQTNLTGQTIFVDDSNSEITWSSQWWTAEDYQVSTGVYNVTPAGNTTHSSATEGDSFAFDFAGTSINVYGVMPWGSDGSIGATFSVDGHSTAQTFTANGAASNGLTNATNYAFFQNTSLSSGNHTLTVNVTSVSGNMPFIIDYLTYIPNFANLDSKPNFTGQAGISSGSDSGSSSGPTPSSSGSGSGNSDVSTSTKTSAGAIAGGVVGSLVVIAAILAAIFFYRRRHFRPEQPRYSMRTTDLSESNDRLASTPFTPFTDIPRTSNTIPMKRMESDMAPSVSAPSTVVSGPTYSEKSRGTVLAWNGSEDREYTSTSGYSTPPLGPTPGPGGPRATELRKQIAHLEQQLEEEQMAAQSSSSGVNVSELQSRINMLVAENERLKGDVAPPAYVDGADDSDTGRGSDRNNRTSSSGGKGQNLRDEKQALRFAHE